MRRCQRGRDCGILKGMADEEAHWPHPGLAEAERRIRAAMGKQDSTGSELALLHAQLGVILAAQSRHSEAISEYRTAIGYIGLLGADGEHQERYVVRHTSLSSPPPNVDDYNLERLEAEVRVSLVESLATVGDAASAQAEMELARPLTRHFFRRRLRKRLDKVAAGLAADPRGPGTTDVHTVARQLRQLDDPAQQRALRLRLANGYLDAGDYPAAAREALLLLQAADEAGDALVRAGARQVLGLSLEAQGRPAEALPILSDAFRDLHNHGDAASMIGMAEALAARLLDAGDPAGAATVLRTSAEAAASSGDAAAEVSIRTMLGVALDAGGDRTSAVEALTAAADQAAAQGAVLAQADALHSLAVLLGGNSTTDDLVEALSLLDEAKRLYAAAGRPERVAGCDHEVAAMLGRHASYDAAATRYRAALQIYQSLPVSQRDAGAWPDEVADCQRNLDWLTGDRSAATDSLFSSGGHAMSHPQGV